MHSPPYFFWKGFLLTFLSLFFSVSICMAQENFENKKFGFSMQSPKEWIAIQESEIKENLENFDLTDQQTNDLLTKSKGKILLGAFIKYDPSEKEGLIPKIEVTILSNSTQNYPQFKTAITNNSYKIKEIFKDFEFIQEPQEIVISGIKSVIFIGKFSLTMQDGNVLKVRSRVLSIPRKNYHIQIAMVDGQTEEDNSALFDELTKTIKLVNK